MRTSCLGFFYASVFCLVWLTKQSAGSDPLEAPRVVTAAYGESVTVLCRYNRKYLGNNKYWCRGKIFYLCHKLVQTPKNENNDRVSIAEDKEALAFNITMTSLTDSDEDMYWCAIRVRSGKDIHKAIWLNVSHAVTTIATTITSSPVGHEEIRSWEVLRWIIFISLLCSLALTHTVTWRMDVKRGRTHTGDI